MHILSIQQKHNILKFLKRWRLDKPVVQILGLLYYTYFKIKHAFSIQGKKNLPKGAFILVGHHSSVADAYIAMSAFSRLGKRIHALVHDKEWRDPRQRFFIELLELIPRIWSGDTLVKIMTKFFLEKGKIVGITPEGMYNRGKKVMKGHTGVARLYFYANRNGPKYPIVPVASLGASQSYPPIIDGHETVKKSRCKITGIIGEPFHLEIPKEINHEVLEESTNYIMQRVASLIGQNSLAENWHKNR